MSAEFSAGDRVQVNGSLIATIQSIDPEGDRIVYVITPAGGGSDTVYAHISQTRLEHLLTPAVTSESRGPSPEEVQDSNLIQPAVVADEKPSDGTVSEGGTPAEEEESGE